MMSTHRSCARLVCVEILESRRLLSASAALSLPPLAADRAAVTVHSTAPTLTGAPFVGTASDSAGATLGISIAVASQRKSGGVSGTITVDLGAGQTLLYTFSGSVNRHGGFTLHAKSGGHKVLTVTGTATATTMSGKFNSASRHSSSHGTFTTHR